MFLAHQLRNTGHMSVYAAECGFPVHRQRYLRTALTSQHVCAYLTTLSFRRATYRLSSTPNLLHHTIVNSVIKIADVRRRSLWEPERCLATTSSMRTCSSTITPTGTDAGVVKNDKDTSRLLSNIKELVQTFNKRARVQLLITYKTIEETSPRDNKNEHEHVEQVHKCPSNRIHSPGSRKYFAHCGRHYTRQGDKKNHEENCVKCRIMQQEERDKAQTHHGLLDMVKGLVVSKLKTITASGVLDAKHHSTNHPQKRKPREIDRNTAQLISVELSRVTTSKLTPGDEQGYIYILRDSKNGLLKIGFAKDPKVRIKQHNKCGRDLKPVYVTHCVKWTKRAERLIKLDLKHLCRPWFCPSCRQRHVEYFEVTEERAKAIVERWTDWINGNQPYSSDGNITPLWNHLILFGRRPNQPMRTYDHEARWAHWSWVLSSPSEGDLRHLQESTAQHGFGHDDGLMPVGKKSDRTMRYDDLSTKVSVARI